MKTFGKHLAKNIVHFVAGNVKFQRKKKTKHTHNTNGKRQTPLNIIYGQFDFIFIQILFHFKTLNSSYAAPIENGPKKRGR